MSHLHHLRTAGLLSLLLLLGSSTMATARPGACGPDRQALIAAGLMARVEQLRGQRVIPPTGCVVIGVVKKGAFDTPVAPSKWVLFALREHLKAEVFRVDQPARCPGTYPVVVSEPYCVEPSYATFAVPGEHCGLHATNSRGRWVARPAEVCE